MGAHHRFSGQLYTPVRWAFGLAACLASGPAAAELTARQVWDEMASAMEDYGYSVTATDVATPDGLDVTDILLRQINRQDNVTVEIAIDAIDLINNDEGTVAVSVSPVIPVIVEMTPAGQDQVTVTFEMRSTVFDMLVSGAPGDVSVTYVADQMTLSMTEMQIDGVPMRSASGRFEVVVDDLAGSLLWRNLEGLNVIREMDARQLSYDVEIIDTGATEKTVISGILTAPFFYTDTTRPKGFEAAGFDPLTNTATSVEIAAGYDSSVMELGVMMPGGVNSLTSNSEAARVNLAVRDGGLQYDGRSEDQTFQVTSFEFPVPVEVTVAELALQFDMPMAQPTTPQEFDVDLTVRGFEISDLLWRMLDANAVLPRDPVNIALGLSGLATAPLADMFAPDAQTLFGDGLDRSPLSLQELRLDTLAIDALGARLGGTGAFTFEYDDLDRSNGVPRPEGEVRLTLDGAQGVLDDLIAMGVLSRDDAMGVRMMMGVFAVPGERPDSLTSVLSINALGHVMANGMRIR